MNGKNTLLMVSLSNHTLRSISPSLLFPRVTGEEIGGGLNVLNGWNVLNDYSSFTIFSPLA